MFWAREASCSSTSMRTTLCSKRDEWVAGQVLVRFQWVMEVMRGQSTHMEVSLEGLATSVMGGLQDELFNLTLDNLQVCFPAVSL